MPWLSQQPRPLLLCKPAPLRLRVSPLHLLLLRLPFRLYGCFCFFGFAFRLFHQLLLLRLRVLPLRQPLLLRLRVCVCGSTASSASRFASAAASASAAPSFCRFLLSSSFLSSSNARFNLRLFFASASSFCFFACSLAEERFSVATSAAAGCGRRGLSRSKGRSAFHLHLLLGLLWLPFYIGLTLVLLLTCWLLDLCCVLPATTSAALALLLSLPRGMLDSIETK